MCTYYLIANACDVFKCLVAQMKTWLKWKVKIFQNDWVPEYLFYMFKGFYEEKGIRGQLMIPRTPSQNVVIEHRSWTLLDMVKSTMAHTNLPISFLGGGDKLLTTACILNSVPRNSVSATPYKSRYRKSNLWTTYVHGVQLCIIQPINMWNWSKSHQDRVHKVSQTFQTVCDVRGTSKWWHDRNPATLLFIRISSRFPRHW